MHACTDDGDAWERKETCDPTEGEICEDGLCVDACERAQLQRSYVGCEFFAADLDNAALDDTNDASRQQFAVVVSNPNTAPVDVSVEINHAEPGETPDTEVVASAAVPAGDLEVFELPRRELDGSSADGLNDGTHTALSSNAFRITSSLPITAYQFNPLANVDVFSNDASLLLPTSAWDERYTAVAWPQTIGDSENPDQDFDPTSRTEDLRSFMTILAVEPDTHVEVRLGKDVVKVVGQPGVIESRGPDETIEATLGAFDVLNLETQGFNADFTGSTVDADKPVGVFVGSEASDVPMFGTYATRQCCADHLEEQLFPDVTLGTRFLVARMPPRTVALNDALGGAQTVAEVNEPEWVRVLAVADGETTVETTLPFPNDRLTLNPHESTMLRADEDFAIHADQPVAVLQALPSQQVVGIPSRFPGGDPALVIPAPIEQYRRDYILLTPDKYAFDFLTITAPKGTRIRLDDAPLPETCETGPIAAPPGSKDGVEWEVHRCQLSFPEVTPPPNVQIKDGDQDDGVHTVVADQEIGVVVYGFDRFVSYAYAGGLDLEIIN